MLLRASRRHGVELLHRQASLRRCRHWLSSISCPWTACDLIICGAEWQRGSLYHVGAMGSRPRRRSSACGTLLFEWLVLMRRHWRKSAWRMKLLEIQPRRLRQQLQRQPRLQRQRQPGLSFPRVPQPRLLLRHWFRLRCLGPQQEEGDWVLFDIESLALKSTSWTRTELLSCWRARMLTESRRARPSR